MLLTSINQRLHAGEPVMENVLAFYSTKQKKTIAPCQLQKAVQFRTTVSNPDILNRKPTFKYYQSP